MLDSFAFCLDSGREFLASNKIFPMHPKEIIELKSSDCNGLIRKLKREDSWDTKENILVILHSDPRTNLLIAFSWRKFTGYLKLTWILDMNTFFDRKLSREVTVIIYDTSAHISSKEIVISKSFSLLWGKSFYTEISNTYE